MSVAHLLVLPITTVDQTAAVLRTSSTKTTTIKG
jgi:hypothetical protein